MAAFDRLLNDAQRRVLAGDFAGAAPIFERARHELVRVKRWPEALAATLSAARLRIMAGQLDAAGTLLDAADGLSQRTGQRLDLLRVQAELADARGNRAERRDAWRAVCGVATGLDRLGALRRLADLAREMDRPAEMLPLLEEAAEIAGQHQRTEHEADAWLEHSMALGALGRHDDAAWSLSRAEALLTQEPSAIRARIIGQRGVLALTRRELPEALALANEARATAVAAADAQSYLAASMLLVMIHQESGDEVSAYDTLIRARESLRDLLGDDGAALVQPALDAFEARHGPEKVSEIHQAWERTRRPHHSQK